MSWTWVCERGAWWIALAVCLSVMSEAAADDGDVAADGAGEIAPTDSLSGPISLDTISILATRNPIEAFEFPGMVTVFELERLQAHQASTTDDFLQFVPNVEFTGGPRRSGEVPSIRGFSNADVVITVDGARQNLESGHDGRFLIDPSLIAAAEVLRGPASSLYGSGGTGGLIGFRTVRAEDLLTPGEEAGLRVSAAYQTVNNEYAETITGFARPSEGLDLVGSVTKRDSGSINLGDGSKLDRTDDDILAGLAKVGYAFGGAHRIEGSYVRFANQAQEPNNGQDPDALDIVDKDIASDNYRLAYAYKNPDDALLDLDMLAYYADFRIDETRLDALGTGPAGERLKRDLDTLGIRLDNRSRVELGESGGVTFTYGAEAYRDRQNGSSASGERDGVPDADAAFEGVFAQAEIRLAEPLGAGFGDFLIVPGLRFDHYTSSSDLADDNEDDQLSPRFGISYLPAEWAVLFASYGEAFRAPTINEAFPDGVHFRIPIGPGITNRFVANADLQPQRTATLEVGAGLDLRDVASAGDRLRLKFSHFRTEGRDFIDLEVVQPTPFVDCNPFIPGACDGTTRAINVPRARLWGNELEATYETSTVLLSFGVSTINGLNLDTGDHLGLLTPPQATLDLAYRLSEIDTLIGYRALGALRFNETDEAGEEREPYLVHNVYFAWAPLDGALKGFRIDLGVDNLADAAYARVFTDSLEPGRNFKARVGYGMAF